MGIGALIHSVKALGHLCVGEIGEAAAEGSKAIASIAIGISLDDAFGGTQVGDSIDSLT